MVAIIKTPTTTVQRAGPIVATAATAYPPVAMAVLPARWSVTSRVFFPTNGHRYNQFEMAIIAESDETLWNGLVEEELARVRQRSDGMSAAAMTNERARLRAWHAAYKAWAVI